jgi:hypothetical protein
VARRSDDRTLRFTDEEMARLRRVCADPHLRITFGEFLHFAAMQAIDEYEGYVRDDQERWAYYERLNRDVRGIPRPTERRANGNR